MTHVQALLMEFGQTLLPIDAAPQGWSYCPVLLSALRLSSRSLGDGSVSRMANRQ
jgi:hypothetical protein